MITNKVVLAYSGGLDTSVILRWLQQKDFQVICFTADVGQGEELEPAREKAKKMGAIDIHVVDVREEFVRDFVFPMFRGNVLYEGEYLLGTSIARPLIAKYLVEIAQKTGASFVAHGATGKGNDQVRFELGVAALAPHLQVIAPWREWNLSSRASLLAYCQEHNIPVDMQKQKDKPPYSMDANLLHISYEGGELEDPWVAPDENMWRLTKSIDNAQAKKQTITIDFEKGDPVAIDGQKLSPKDMLATLNSLGGLHGIGRTDIVENRFVGMKSRGCYETPGGTILLKARRAMESITLDRESLYNKDSIMPRYAQLIYNGFWFSPERYAMQAMIDATAQYVSGTVRLDLHKGTVLVTGRKSPYSLFDAKISSFEDDQGSYNQADAKGFITLHGLRLRAWNKQKLPIK